MTFDSAISPRINKLQQALAAGNASAFDCFWQEIHHQGTPLVEPLEYDNNHVLVTFLWQAKEDIENVVVIGQLGTSQNFMENQMKCLPHTDLWFKTYKLRSDLRVAYCLSPNDSLIPFHEVEDWVDRARTWQPDPLNPHSLKVPEQKTQLSILELPSAPSQPWAEPRYGILPGQITKHRLRSDILNNERNVWIHTPADYTTDGKPYSLLLLFDGWAYIDVVHTPITLDNLLADRLIPPLVTIFLDIIDFETRSRELACSTFFADFLAQELVPWVRQHYAITSDPAQSIVGGLSLGGLTAAFMGLNYPNIFGNVLVQSGSFWWKPEGEVEHEWLARQFAITDKSTLNFHLDAGLLETNGNDGDGPSILSASRHLRNVLQAKGYPVHYAEYPGGHDYLYWRGSLADGLIALLGQLGTD